VETSEFVRVVGPSEGVQLLFDEDQRDGLALHPSFADAYGGSWALPEPADGRPYTMVNFVVSRDGRISYAEPGEVGGAAVNNGCHADVWMMGLFRARCDAVMVGDGTARAEPEHIWTPTHLGGPDAAAFEQLRHIERRAAMALQVLCSFTGDIGRHWAVVSRQDIPLVVATIDAGVALAEERLHDRPNAQVVSFGRERVDTAALGRWLHEHHGVQSLLCEGGPRLYGSLIADGAVDDEFVTLSPLMVGSTASSGARRPSLVEGVGFAPGHSPQVTPVSLRRSGNHLMLRSRFGR
jgi:5-amino-6-(5-phosphoribosylamino)uracil reductase